MNQPIMLFKYVKKYKNNKINNIYILVTGIVQEFYYFVIVIFITINKSLNLILPKLYNQLRKVNKPINPILYTFQVIVIIMEKKNKLTIKRLLNIL